MWVIEQTAGIITAAIIFFIPALRSLYLAPPLSLTIPRFNKTREAVFDSAKGIAILAVILIHVGSFLKKDATAAELPFVFGINNLLRFAVPWFLIASGALLDPLLAKQRVPRWYAKRLFAIGIPYLMATAAIAIGTGDTISEFLKNVITGRAAVPYYFIIVIVQCYALYPFLNAIRHKRFFLPAAFAVTFISFLLPETWHVRGFPLVFQYLFFFCYGMHIRSFALGAKQNMDGKHWRIILLISVIVMLFFPAYYYNVSLFYSVALFQLLLRASSPHRFFCFIGERSLWIFLTHLFLVQLAVAGVRTLSLPFLPSFFLAGLFALPASVAIGIFFSRFSKQIALPAPSGRGQKH